MRLDQTMRETATFGMGGLRCLTRSFTDGEVRPQPIRTKRKIWCPRRDSNSQTRVSKTGFYSNSCTLALVYRGGFEPPRLTRWPVHFRSGSCTCASSVLTDTESWLFTHRCGNRAPGLAHPSTALRLWCIHPLK